MTRSSRRIVRDTELDLKRLWPCVTKISFCGARCREGKANDTSELFSLTSRGSTQWHSHCRKLLGVEWNTAPNDVRSERWISHDNAALRIVHPTQMFPAGGWGRFALPCGADCASACWRGCCDAIAHPTLRALRRMRTVRLARWETVAEHRTGRALSPGGEMDIPQIATKDATRSTRKLERAWFSFGFSED